MLKTSSFEIATLSRGDENSSRIAILMPGRLDTKDYVNFTSHADYLAHQGFFAIALDPPGTWDSPGVLKNYTTSMYLRVINELIDYFDNRPTLLVGHSRGGATAMLASTNPAVTGLVVINSSYGKPSPPDPNKLENGELPEYRDLPPGNVRTEEKVQFKLPMSYFKDGAKYDPLDALTRFKGPKLLIHATEDEFVELDRVRDIFSHLSEPKMFQQIDSAHDYRLYPEAIKSVENSLGEFTRKYLNI